MAILASTWMTAFVVEMPPSKKPSLSLKAGFLYGTKREGKFTFTGIRIQQDSTGRIHLDQKEYINNITPINIPRDRRKGERHGL